MYDYLLHNEYNLSTFKAFWYICVFMYFYDKHVYFFHSEYADSSEPQRDHKLSEHPF